MLSFDALVGQLGWLLDLNTLSTDFDLSVLLNLEDLIFADLFGDPVRLLG